MIQEAQRVALAKIDGWTENPILRDYHRWIRSDSIHADLPDYLNDLNAIARIEAKLEQGNRTNYTTELRRIVLRDHSSKMINPDSGLVYDHFFYSATASQRSEALLKALNLWEEAK